MSEEDVEIENKSKVKESENSNDPEPEVMPPELDVFLESYDSDEAKKNSGTQRII